MECLNRSKCSQPKSLQRYYLLRCLSELAWLNFSTSLFSWEVYSLSIGCVIFHTPFLIVLFSKVFRDDRNGVSAWKKVKKRNVGYSSPVSFVCFRAWIPLKNIWELNNKPPTKKRSKALVQAEEELKIYLRILNAMGDEQVSLQYNTCGNLYTGFLCPGNWVFLPFRANKIQPSKCWIQPFYNELFRRPFLLSCLLLIMSNVLVACHYTSGRLLAQNDVPERHWRHSSVFIVNFEQISDIFLVFPLLTLNK